MARLIVRCTCAVCWVDVREASALKEEGARRGHYRFRYAITPLLYHSNLPQLGFGTWSQLMTMMETDPEGKKPSPAAS